MSEFHCVVVEIGKVGKHPNADALEITQVLDAYPCIMKTGQFKQGDKAVYIPIDSLVPTSDPRFSFLTENEEKKRVRIKAKKLRGIFSMGLLVTANPEWQVGQNVQMEMGIEKYEPETMVSLGGECEKDIGIMPTYTDLEGLRKYKNYLTEGEEVVLTEKIHGSNFRAVYSQGRLWVGSHHQVKKYNTSNIFWKAAIEADLENKLKDCPDIVLYGEVHGQVQKGFDYGIKKGNVALRFFDAFDWSIGRYMDFDDLSNLLIKLNLEMVPVLYRGPWNLSLMEMGEGQSTLGNHIREGFVLKSIKETYRPGLGRCILKYVGQGYLLNKNS